MAIAPLTIIIKIDENLSTKTFSELMIKKAVVILILSLRLFLAQASVFCDVTGDSAVDIADVNRIINQMLGKRSPLPPITRFSIGDTPFRLIAVDGGTFSMGATAEQVGANGDEYPVHQVSLSDYLIGETEVTQAMWTAAGKENQSEFKGPQNPVERVGWNDVQDFLKLLTSRCARKFRLPTEAEWEFAARGGSRSQGFIYSGGNSINDYGWCWPSCESHPHPVGMKRPNELGLYDMSGNIQEWCSDMYAAYSEESQSDPQWLIGSCHVARGGSWDYGSDRCRVSSRMPAVINSGYHNLGFRLAMSSSDFYDIDGDSTVDISDINAIINAMLGR